MIISCRVEGIESMIDTEDTSYVPEVAADLLARCADAVLKMYAALPESPAE